MARDARRAWARTLVGRTLADRYRLERLIDVGGMGAVFEAVHLEVQRAVAIKTVVPGALDDAGTERLRREARQAAAVGGRGVVDVMDFGVDEVCGPFLVMELLSGETLSSRLSRQRPLPASEAVCIGLEVLDTLMAVHARGIVHRDLKPDNLFLAREHGEEVVKVLDFGLARASRADGDTLTATGAVVGTPRYMAPEQARGESTIDARSDIYSVGAMLYVMLSGRRPYEELASADVVDAVAAGPARPLAELAPHLPPALVEVVERAMCHDREGRYPDARTMRAALARIDVSSLAPIDEPTATGAPIERGPRAQEELDPVALAHRDRAFGDAPAQQPTAAPARGRARRGPWVALSVLAAALAAAVAWSRATREATPEVVRAPRPDETASAPAAPRSAMPATQPDREREAAPSARAPSPTPTSARPAAQTQRRLARSVTRAHPPAGEPVVEPAPSAPEPPRARSGSLSMEDF